MASIDNSTVLYLKGESLVDRSLYHKTITNNGVTINDNGRFGKGLDLGTDQYLKVEEGMQGVDLSGDFSFEWWEYSTGASATASALFVNKNSIKTNWACCMMFGYGGKSIYAGSGTTSWNGFNNVVMKDKIDNEWVHWRLVKKDTTWTSYRNGVKFWSATNAVVVGKVDEDVCSIGCWVDNAKLYTGYNAIIDDFRICNYALCEEDFTPPIKSYSSIDINVTNQTDTHIEFNITKLGLEDINKVEVLLNNELSETYTSNFGDITYSIDKDLCIERYNNSIIIRVVFDEYYTEELELFHYETFNELTGSSNLKDIIDKQYVVLNDIENQKNRLKDILIEKKIELSEEEDKLSILIDKVKELGENPNVNKLYLYDEGNEFERVTGGWNVGYKTYNQYTITKGESMKMNVPFGKVQLCNSKFIDFSKYSTLCIDAQAISTSDYNIYRLGVISSTGNSLEDELHPNYIISKEEKGNRKVYIIDVSDLNLYGYVGIYAQCNSGSETVLDIHKIWLEK